MKGKFKILGHLGVALFLVSALMLAFMPAAPVQAAATEVTDVWVEFPGSMAATHEVTTYTALDDGTNGLNKKAVAVNMIVHFTAETALKANIDTITIYFPDGSTELSGSGNTSGYFDLSSASVGAGSQLVCVDPDGSGTTYGYHDITTAATAAGYRLKVTTPIDIAAGASPYIFIAEGTGITTSSVEGHKYKIKMQTSKDTTWVLSPTFALGATASTVTILREAITNFVASPAIAGSGATFTFTFNTKTALTAASSLVTVIFPAGTTVPSSIAAAQIECQNYGGNEVASASAGGYQACSTTPTVNSDARMVTLTVPVGSTATKGYGVRFKTGAGITLPQVITEAYSGGSNNFAYLKYRVYTSVDRLMVEATAAASGTSDGCFKISPGAAYKLGFNNDAYYGITSSHTYSDDCSIINGFTEALYLQMQDQYGNLVYSGTGHNVTVNLAPTLYTGQDTANSTASQLLSHGEPESSGVLYFRATTAGTHTITASYGSYVDGTWEVTVAPAVELYDANLSLVNTYAPLSTAATHTSEYGGYYLNQAVSAAMAGDTIKLGEGIYDLTGVGSISVNKAITIEAVSGTTPVLRKTGTATYNHVSITKGATIDGLTFRGLRWTTEFSGGFVTFCPTSTAGIIIKNCTFENFNAQYGALYWFTGGSSSATTSGTITNNTFQNVIGAGACHSVLWVEIGYENLSGLTISDNTFTNNTGAATSITGASGSATGVSITDVTISGNTISSNRTIDSAINIWNELSKTVALGSAALPIKVINNEISGCNNAAIRLRTVASSPAVPVVSAAFPGVRIKRNYIHDNAGTAIEVKAPAAPATGAGDTSTTANIASAIEIMYNDIVDNAHTSGTYGVYNNLTDKSATVKVTAQYNWFGDASGPTVTANVGGTGDTVSTYMVYSPWLYKSRTHVVADNVSYTTARMNLVSGWNTLSTPVQLIEAADAIDELISADDMEIGFYYDATTGWQQIETGKVLSPCDAVYIKMTNAASPLLKFDAGAYTNPTKELKAGWNLISLAYLNSAGMYELHAVASVYKTAAGLPGYSQVISPSLNDAQTDLFGTSGSSWTYSSGQAVNTNRMYAGLGYWCYMQNAATLAGFTITPIVPDLD